MRHATLHRKGTNNHRTGTRYRNSCGALYDHCVVTWRQFDPISIFTEKIRGPTDRWIIRSFWFKRTAVGKTLMVPEWLNNCIYSPLMSLIERKANTFGYKVRKSDRTRITELAQLAH